MVAFDQGLIAGIILVTLCVRFIFDAVLVGTNLHQ